MGLYLAGLACFRKFKSRMPIPGSSSLAISSACHLNPSVEASDEPHGVAAIETKALQWGVVDARHEGMEHCSFTNEDVNKRVNECAYR
jgi:hypothetical protein